MTLNEMYKGRNHIGSKKSEGQNAKSPKFEMTLNEMSKGRMNDDEIPKGRINIGSKRGNVEMT